jgi:hypothetical protein
LSTCGRPSLLQALSFLCTAHLLACGANDPIPVPAPRTEADSAPFSLAGTVTFDARHPTSTGASSEVEERPARRVRVEARDVEGHVLADAITTDTGAYTLDGNGAATRVVVIASRSLDLDRAISVAFDELGTRVHSEGFQITSGANTDVHLRADDALGGALHILDTLARGYETVERWAGLRLPELYVYWGPDVTVDWSYYRGERGGRFCLELLAGRRSERTTTDTDEHDEAIILHELGHFVFDQWTSHSSIGGRHPRGSLVDPGVAWEEGRATWLATAILGDPAYVDSRGIEGSGSARVDEVVERPQDPRGPGSETSVAGVLWDLSDGVEGDAIERSPDTDGDGLAIGPAAVLRAMVSAAEVPQSYVALHSFLHHLIDTHVVGDDELRAMLSASGEPASILETPWPLELAANASVTGSIDGRTQPAPSGGENRADNGYDAVRTYRVPLAAPGTLHLSLIPSGTGSSSDHTDLTLELRSDRAAHLTTSALPVGGESITQVLRAGTYIVYVRDAGTGNAADFTLTASLTP